MKLTPTFRYRHFVFAGMLALALSFNAIDEVFVGSLHAQTAPAAPAPAGATVEKDKDSGKPVVTTPSGLKYVDLAPGTGPVVKDGDLIAINYVGKLADGSIFDASERHGKPLTYVLGEMQLVPGWMEGVSTMKVGGKRKLIIPSQLGYGAEGRSPVIPPNATLIFEIEVVSAKPTK